MNPFDIIKIRVMTLPLGMGAMSGLMACMVGVHIHKFIRIYSYIAVEKTQWTTSRTNLRW